MQSNFKNSLSLICSCPFIPSRPYTTNLSTSFSQKNSPLSSISDPRLWTNIAVHKSQTVQVTNCLWDNLTKPVTNLVWSKRLGNTQLYHRVAWSFSIPNAPLTNNNHGWSFINCFCSLEDVWCRELTLARLTKNQFPKASVQLKIDHKLTACTIW